MSIAKKNKKIIDDALKIIKIIDDLLKRENFEIELIEQGEKNYSYQLIKKGKKHSVAGIITTTILLEMVNPFGRPLRSDNQIETEVIQINWLNVERQYSGKSYGKIMLMYAICKNLTIRPYINYAQLDDDSDRSDHIRNIYSSLLFGNKEQTELKKGKKIVLFGPEKICYLGNNYLDFLLKKIQNIDSRVKSSHSSVKSSSSSVKSSRSSVKTGRSSVKSSRSSVKSSRSGGKSNCRTQKNRKVTNFNTKL